MVPFNSAQQALKYTLCVIKQPKLAAASSLLCRKDIFYNVLTRTSTLARLAVDILLGRCIKFHQNIRRQIAISVEQSRRAGRTERASNLRHLDRRPGGRYRPPCRTDRIIESYQFSTDDTRGVPQRSACKLHSNTQRSDRLTLV